MLAVDSQEEDKSMSGSELIVTSKKECEFNRPMKACYALWAKKSNASGSYKWLPLPDHLYDTQQVIDRLWEFWLDAGQKRFLISSISPSSEDIAKKLVRFLGAVHDLGKATPAFQLRFWNPQSSDFDAYLLEKLERVGFLGCDEDDRPSNPEKTHHSLAGEVLLRKFGVGEDIACIIGGHHGKPINDLDTEKEQKSYPSNYYLSENPADPIYKQWAEVQQQIFSWALNSSGFSCPDDLPSISKTGQVLLSGLLIMADWIASNEEYFPLIPIDQERVEDRTARFQTGWMRWYKTEPWQVSSLPELNELYERRFGDGFHPFVPRPEQEIFAKVIDQTGDPGIFILEAPMGSGKTEAALIGTEQLAMKTGRSGLFFGLPTQATSNGIFPRIKQWLDRVAEEEGQHVSLRLVHGKAALNEDFQSIIRPLASSIDYDGEGSVIVNTWFSGRKTAALDDFVVGTVDNFLLAALKQKHLALRHLGFSKKVVVIDEVHAYDAYMDQYLQMALEWMGSYGTPVILLSATLPERTRMEMIKAYSRGKKIRGKTIKEQMSAFKKDAYPLITYTDGKQVKQFSDFPKQEEKVISIVRLADENLINQIQDLLVDGGVIGLIVNTVKRAQKLAKELAEAFPDVPVRLIHSGFIATDRVKKEEALMREIGPHGHRPSRQIVMGTQVLEQSLDIDFDCLITDLAPMDLMIQRMGRLHRHKIRRPAALKEPVCYILGCDDQFNFEAGSQAVYGDYLLIRSQYFLPEKIHIPTDISPLVQKVYDEKAFPLDEELQGKYEEAKKANDNVIGKKKNSARTYRIQGVRGSLNQPDNKTLIGWLEDSDVIETEERAYAQVRDSQETIEVVALKRVGEKGYGFFGKNVDLSGDIGMIEIAKKVSAATLRLPSLLSAPCNINKTLKELEDYNKKYLGNWQSQAWLKGTLGIIFDKDNHFFLKLKKNGYKLSYSEEYGLEYEEYERKKDGTI